MRIPQGFVVGAGCRKQPDSEVSSNAAFPGTADPRWEMPEGAEYPRFSAKHKEGTLIVPFLCFVEDCSGDGKPAEGNSLQKQIFYDLV